MSDDSKLRAYLFIVEIDGIETARFQKYEGLETETYVYEVEEGGLNHATRKFRGRTRFPNLILEKGITENDSLFNWFKETCLENKKLERKNGSVVLKDTEGNEVKRWNFYRAFPCRWIGPRLVTNLGSDFAVERIEIAHEGIEVDNDSEPQENDNWFHIGQNMSEETNFIGAEECDASIGAIEGYPETGNNSWRADNDKAFIDACNSYNEKYDLSEGDDGYISPKMLKAWAMVESGGSPDAFATDPLQVNNPGDWDDRKTDIAGLAQNQEMTPEISAEAALEWRRYKGYIHDETGTETKWRGDFQAFRRYNGNINPPPASATTDRTEHRDYYADLVIELGSD